MSDQLDEGLVEHWQRAAKDLGVRVTAPFELRDARGKPFLCEAFVHDFGSPTGAIVVSPKTERRVRAELRSLGDALWLSISEKRRPAYMEKYFIDELCDWGWFGPAGKEPSWYRQY